MVVDGSRMESVTNTGSASVFCRQMILWWAFWIPLYSLNPLSPLLPLLPPRSLVLSPPPPLHAPTPLVCSLPICPPVLSLHCANLV